MQIRIFLSDSFMSPLSGLNIYMLFLPSVETLGYYMSPFSGLSFLRLLPSAYALG
jgi:hypothetical protein